MTNQVHVDFDWDDAKELSNARKHKIRFNRAVEVLKDPDANTELDLFHSNDEERWVTVVFDRSGTLLLVVHTYD